MSTASRIHIRSFAIVSTIASVCLPVCAQHSERSPRSTVSGHVVCADSNAPARLAKVTLNPLQNSAGKNAGSIGAVSGATTDMEGAFSIPEVTAGRYLVLVELEGYVSGISGLDSRAREHLKDAALTPPDGSTVVEVANGLPVTVDVTIERGASVSGTIRYDDGSPAIGILVGLERKNSKGAWEPALRSSSQTFSFFSEIHDGSEASDSAGHFHIDGMPPGEYIVHAHLSPQTITLPIAGSGQLGVYDHPGVELDLYSGGAFWRKEAKPIALEAGEDADVEMEVPLGKLRTVSGTVVAASDGHGVSVGTVTLSPQDDPEDARSTEIEEDGRFRFLYVPEGDYVLMTTDAADGPRRPKPSADERTDVINLPDHVYGKVEAALRVGEEAASVTLSVPERETRAAQ